jgi:hypothetical protein
MWARRKGLPVLTWVCRTLGFRQPEYIDNSSRKLWIYVNLDVLPSQALCMALGMSLLFRMDCFGWIVGIQEVIVILSRFVTNSFNDGRERSTCLCSRQNGHLPVDECTSTPSMNSSMSESAL